MSDDTMSDDTMSDDTMSGDTLVREHRETYQGFVRLTAVSTGLIAVVLVLMAIVLL